ncbi:two-component system response regulator BaeR [Aliidiomarina sedimenti]|uniref:Two-component system response regulator BaeR n=1 Tax=Aliidiomarina sedimenti TaxID=1933879 RepID=A0ABY0C080_9GAMM|nr:response regulator [Aliidiomarina sedimenti]RUO30762.1 two-component system response regulator BaeR [Aliidiomarina sedimenti]
MSQPQAHIVVVEDEVEIQQLVADYLQHAGFQVTTFGEGDRALTALTEGALEADLVILDIMLPGLDGLELCQSLRQHSQVPVVFLTARHDEIDRLLGLRLGADDYICKPFSPREVVARVEAILRRQRWLSSSAAEQGTPGLLLDPAALKVKLDNQAIELTPVEFRLLQTLVENPGRVFRRDQLVNAAYDDYRVVSDRTIDSHIKNIRLKLTQVRAEQQFIQSVYGVGYRFEPDISTVSP